jgi:hypothetical protein
VSSACILHTTPSRPISRYFQGASHPEALTTSTHDSRLYGTQRVLQSSVRTTADSKPQDGHNVGLLVIVGCQDVGSPSFQILGNMLSRCRNYEWKGTSTRIVSSCTFRLFSCSNAFPSLRPPASLECLISEQQGTLGEYGKLEVCWKPGRHIADFPHNGRWGVSRDEDRARMDGEGWMYGQGAGRLERRWGLWTGKRKEFERRRLGYVREDDDDPCTLPRTKTRYGRLEHYIQTLVS